MTPPEGDDKMVVNLIAFREKVVRIVEGCFAKEEGFVTNLNGAFEFFINKRENKPAELMGTPSSAPERLLIKVHSQVPGR